MSLTLILDRIKIFKQNKGDKMSLLLSPGRVSALEVKNKIVMAPMCMFCSNEEGLVNSFHMTHYTARAIGGVGLIIVEATAVTPEGRISDSDLGIYTDEQEISHKKLVEKIHHHGSKVALQIAHAGRKSMTSNLTHIAPSAIQFSDDYELPKEMNESEIEDIKSAFLNAAIRAKRAGYDAIELHAAHGYLLNQFLSSSTNKRSDKYGGSLDNRCSLLVEICELLKNEVKLPLIVRISADEWVDGGWNLDNSKYLAKKLKEIIDILHVSAGGIQEIQPLMPPIVPLYQAKYAKEIKEYTGIKTISVGLISTPNEAEALLLGGCCDMVAIGRELLRNPNFVNEAAKTFKEKDKITTQYQRAY